MDQAQLRCGLACRVSAALHELLTTKHLYQYVTVKRPETEEGGQGAEEALVRVWNNSHTQALLQGIWWPQLPQEHPRLARAGGGIPDLEFELPRSVQLYCSTCQGDQAYIPYSPQAGRAPLYECYGYSGSSTNMVQVFLLSYQCQLCQGHPESFLVRRDGLKLTLCGRAPMAQIAVPRDIPSDQEGFYRDAVVAYECKHTLAGIFMLRVLIEQFVYDKVGREGRADKAIDRYMKSLPEDFKRQFPSFGSLYEQLSKAIHEANADEDLFEDVRAAVVRHFEARRLFDLD